MPVVRSVLLVEDDAQQAMALSQGLRSATFDVTVAFDVRTAIHFLDEQGFDLILCDLFLPPGNGLDVLDAIVTRRLRAPFVLMSGQRPDEFDWVQRKYPRITAFVPKPCPFEQLLRVFDRVLQQPS